MQIESGWRKEDTNWVNANGKVRTTMLPLKLAETSVLLTKGPNPQLNFDFAMVSQNGQRIEYGTRASKKKDVFNVELWTPMAQFRNISMHGSLIRSPRNPKEYTVSGQLYRNMATYDINGIVRMADFYPEDARLRLIPKAGGRDGVIELSISEPQGKSKAINFQFSAIEDGKMCQISGGYSVTDDTMDFSVLVESTEPEISRISINGNLHPLEKGHVVGEITLETPWAQLGIDSVRLRSDVVVRKESGHIEGSYQISKNIGRASCTWAWLLARDMQLILESSIERPNANPRIVYAAAKYQNPNKSYKNLFTGGKLSVDSKWNLEVNGTLSYQNADEFEFGLDTQLPAPVGDFHHLGGRYSGNLISKRGEPNVFLEAKYESREARRRYMTRVVYRNSSDLQGLGHIEWGHIGDVSVIEGDFQMLRKPEVKREFYAKLVTPKFKNQDTFFMKGNYDLKADEYHNLM